MSKRLSNRIRTERRQRGWSQAELARRAGISRAEVSAIETGRLRSPSVHAALALSAALGVPAETLFRPMDPPAWAWTPAEAGGARFWTARVGARALRYPVEHTLLGTLAHDGVGDRGEASPGAPTVVIAGCDPAVGVLAGAVARSAGLRVLALSRSSHEALELLSAGRVHLAGVHLGDNDRAVREALGGAPACLVHLARWDAGLALEPGRRMATVKAALRARLRWVGRQRGSGSHRLLEALFAAEGSPLPRGLQHIARDHVAVAETIRSGWAQVGPCVRLAAAQLGLGFLSVEQQAYELCTTSALREDPAVAAVLEVLGSGLLRRQLGELPGYDSGLTGQVREVA